MSFFKINRGLFKLDFIDHYAVLGVPLNADTGAIRKRYLKVVYQLHPDTCKAKDASSQAQATQLLSKLVNPAYEDLKKDRNRAEHQIILTQISRRIKQEGIDIEIVGQRAKSLANVEASTLEQTYHQYLKKLAPTEYKDLHHALDKIAEISELNLVYLLGKQGEQVKKQPFRSSTATVEKSKETIVQDETPTAAVATEAYTRRAKAYIEKENFAQAILELREGLKLDANDSTCHSLLGWAYLKLDKQKMAQIHVKKALQANPREKVALKVKSVLDRREKQSGKRNVSSNDPSKRSGGILGGLFGGNKK